MPNEVRSPARSLNPMRVRSLGRRRHRTAPHFPAELEKRRGARSEVFSSPSWGVTPHFSWNGTAVRRVKWRARGVHAGTSERAGLVTSLGTKPPLCAFRTLRQLPTQPRQDVFACGGGSNLANPIERRARRKASSSLHGRRSLASSPTRCGPIPWKWGVSPLPHYALKACLSHSTSPSRTTITSKRTRQRCSSGWR